MARKDHERSDRATDPRKVDRLLEEAGAEPLSDVDRVPEGVTVVTFGRWIGRSAIARGNRKSS